MAQKNTFDWFTAMLIIQIVYTFAITGFVYLLPQDIYDTVGLLPPNVNNFIGEGGRSQAEEIGETLQNSVNTQTNLPGFIEVGALVFYSGNLLIDLMIRFFTAVPEMLSILVGGVLLLVNVDAYVAAQMQLIVWIMFTVFYVLGLISFIMNIRSGTTVV